MEEGDRHEGNGVPSADVAELEGRIGAKDGRIRDLLEEITSSRLAADEARAAREAGDGHVEALDRDRVRLRERVRELEEEARGRRRRRDGSERRISRLERELERKDGEIARRDHLLKRGAEELEEANRAAEQETSRKDDALQRALGRVEGLERDLEDREVDISDLQDQLGALRAELDSERELRENLADPANRLRAGIELFNDSERRDDMNALSRSLGRPEVHVDLQDGEEPAALIHFTWQGVTWQTYAADPNPAVREPRVYLESSGEDLSGVDRKPPNARIVPGGRVALGL